MTEASIKNAIMGLLSKESGFFWRTGSSPYQQSGCPDIVGVYQGLLVCFEVKTPEAYKKKDRGLTANQSLFIKRLESNGAKVAVVCSQYQVREFLKVLKESLPQPSP